MGRSKPLMLTLFLATLSCGKLNLSASFNGTKKDESKAAPHADSEQKTKGESGADETQAKRGQGALSLGLPELDLSGNSLSLGAPQESTSEVRKPQAPSLRARHSYVVKLSGPRFEKIVKGDFIPGVHVKLSELPLGILKIHLDIKNSSGKVVRSADGEVNIEADKVAIARLQLTKQGSGGVQIVIVDEHVPPQKPSSTSGNACDEIKAPEVKEESALLVRRAANVAHYCVGIVNKKAFEARVDGTNLRREFLKAACRANPTIQDFPNDFECTPDPSSTSVAHHANFETQEFAVRNAVTEFASKFSETRVKPRITFLRWTDKLADDISECPANVICKTLNRTAITSTLVKGLNIAFQIEGEPIVYLAQLSKFSNGSFQLERVHTTLPRPHYYYKGDAVDGIIFTGGEPVFTGESSEAKP